MTSLKLGHNNNYQSTLEKCLCGKSLIVNTVPVPILVVNVAKKDHQTMKIKRISTMIPVNGRQSTF